jgi:hypothetical protein
MLKMEAVYSSETLVSTYKSTRLHKHGHLHRRENLKSHFPSCFVFITYVLLRSHFTVLQIKTKRFSFRLHTQAAYTFSFRSRSNESRSRSSGFPQLGQPKVDSVPKHHTMGLYGWRGGKAPHILDIGTRWRRAIRSKFWLFYTRVKCWNFGLILYCILLVLFIKICSKCVS